MTEVVRALRIFKRERTFAAAATLTLALACAAAISVFGVVNAELWAPLPFPAPRQLVIFRGMSPAGVPESISLADFLWVRDRSQFTQFVAAQPITRRVLRRETSEYVSVRPVSANFFATLGAPPRVGRGFSSADELSGRVCIVSDLGWTRLFDKASGLVGQSIVIDGEGYEVVGVTAGTRLQFDAEPEIYVPMNARAPTDTARTLDVFGRMRQGISLTEANAEIQTIQQELSRATPADHAGHTVQLQDLQHATSGFNWRQLYFFLGAALLVTVLACVNVATLLLVRTLRRQREFATRVALGIGPGALLKQLIGEAVVLLVPGVFGGALLAALLLRVVLAYVPAGYLVRGSVISVDVRMVIFVAALCCVPVVLLSLVPLRFAASVQIDALLRGGNRQVGESRLYNGARSLLVVGQITIALVLLTVVGLFLLSFVRLASTPLGFDDSERVTMTFSLPADRYKEDGEVRLLSDLLLEAMRGVPGAVDVALGSRLPLDRRGGPAVQVQRVDGSPVGERPPTALIVSASPGYFKTLGIQIIQGREFLERDTVGSPRVAVINERLATRLFPGESAIGRRIQVIPRMNSGWTNKPGVVTVEGVVDNVKHFSINEIDFNSIYLPFSQAPAPTFDALVRVGASPASVAPLLRAAVSGVDSGLPLSEPSSLSQRVAEALRPNRFNLMLVAWFGISALMISAVGVYGTVACAVQERIREYGLRLALGASPRKIVVSTIARAARLGIAGGVAGIALSLLLSKLIGDALYLVPGRHTGLLYRVSLSDPVVLMTAALAVVLVAVTAAYFPARTATRVDPVASLRHE